MCESTGDIAHYMALATEDLQAKKEQKWHDMWRKFYPINAYKNGERDGPDASVGRVHSKFCV